MKNIIIIVIMTFLVAGFFSFVENYIDSNDYNSKPSMNNSISFPLYNLNDPFEFINSKHEIGYNENDQSLNDQNISEQDDRINTTIKLINRAVIKEEGDGGYILLDDIYEEEYDSDSNLFLEPGLVFTFQVLGISNGSVQEPISGGEVMLNISGKYAVFNNYTVNYTDSQGYVSFIFNYPLTDTDWNYQLPSTAPVELEIIAEFLGNEYFKPSKTMPIETTHWPKDIIIGDPLNDYYPFNICFGWPIFFILISLVFFLSNGRSKK